MCGQTKLTKSIPSHSFMCSKEQEASLMIALILFDSPREEFDYFQLMARAGSGWAAEFLPASPLDTTSVLSSPLLSLQAWTMNGWYAASRQGQRVTLSSQSRKSSNRLLFLSTGLLFIMFVRNTHPGLIMTDTLSA